MSTLIYCQSPLSATPYYLEDASLNIYSLEELSYYILNNVYMLSTKLMNQELCNWIGRELKQPKLASELLTMVQNNSPLHVFIGHLLGANGYASAKEIKDALAIISTFENKSESERKKMRADRLMSKERLVDAIYEYETLLVDDIAKTMPKVVEGDVYHNLGCSFARLFIFDEAVKCFDEAYKRNQKKQSLHCLLYAARCAKDKDLFDSYVSKYLVSREEVDEALKVVSLVTSREGIVEFDNAINELINDEGKRANAISSMAGVVKDWKEDYIRLCKI